MKFGGAELSVPFEKLACPESFAYEHVPYMKNECM